MKKEKIALIAHYGEDFYKTRVDFVNFLEKKNVECISFIPEDDYKAQIDELKKEVYYYRYSRSWKFIFSLIRVYLFLIRHLKKEKPKLFFTYKFFPNIVGIMAGRKAKINKIIATVAGIGFLEKRDKNILIKLIFNIYIKILDKADFVVTQNSDDLNMLKKYLNRPKFILTNGSGVNPENFSDGFIYNTSFINRHNLDVNKKYITFCSRIVKEKGIKELIKAYNSVNIDYDLIIAGWFEVNSLEREVLDLIKTNQKIHYLGYQKNVTDLLSITDVVILPSYYPEGVPRSLIESLSLGKIIITTDHKGCRETCLNGKNGFLVKPNSVESIVSSLKLLNILNAHELLEYKENSIKLFNEKFHRDIVFNKIWNEVN